jgi:hypothetical protein
MFIWKPTLTVIYVYFRNESDKIVVSTTSKLPIFVCVSCSCK